MQADCAHPDDSIIAYRCGCAFCEVCDEQVNACRLPLGHCDAQEPGELADFGETYADVD